MTPASVKSFFPAHLFRLLASSGTWLVAILGTVGVAGLLAFLAGSFDSKVPEQSAHQARSIPADAVIVEVQTIQRPRYETAVGTIKPIHESAIAAKFLAKVIEVRVTAGQRVDADEVLVKLNDDELQSRLKQAEAQLQAAEANSQQAQSDLLRAQQLVQGNAISRAEFEAAATAVRTSAAEVERASRAIEESKVFLGYATILAPFGGIVVDKQVEPGDTVVPGQTLLTIYDPTQMQLVANVRESLAMQLKIGQELPAKLESFDYECLATVREVVPQADVGSRSFQVKVSGPCPPGIYSGMFGRLLLPLGDETITVIPATAVKHVGQLTLVDAVVGQALVRRHVQLGRLLDSNYEVLSGLKAGERVVVASPAPARSN